MRSPILFWIGFHVLIAILLYVDLRFFGKRPAGVRMKSALLLSGCWIGIALLFNLFIYYTLGKESALQFFTGYLVEKSLSIDNLFIFLLFFLHFRIPYAQQHKVLFWGILGAIVFRITLILAGVALIHAVHWMYYVFGLFLMATGIKLSIDRNKMPDPTKGWAFRLFQALLPVSKSKGEDRFFVRERGKWKATSLFLVLLTIECTDILFALDSIPAVFAITTDPFLIYTSNVFAVLGLRALHFVVSSSLEKFRYYRYGLAAILVFVGGKMILADVVFISVPISLLVIASIIATTALFSFTFRKLQSGH